MNAIAKQSDASLSRPILSPQTFDQLLKFSEFAASSDLMPRDYKGKPANIFLAVQMGSELGLAPMQALQSISVINGRPGVWGDGMIGLCRQSPLCEDIREWIDGEGDERTAFCEAKRRGAPSPILGRFSVADAKKASLWTKQGPWAQYPDRMLQNRARGYALRDAFPDLLRGLKSVEELRDTPEERPEPRPVQSVQSRPMQPNEPLGRAHRAEPAPLQPTSLRDMRPKPMEAPRSVPTRAEIDQILGGDDIPVLEEPKPEPKPDRARLVADRLRERMGEVVRIIEAEGPDRANDAYNGVMGNEGLKAEWAKIRDERPELDSAMQDMASETLNAIIEARALAADAPA